MGSNKCVGMWGVGWRKGSLEMQESTDQEIPDSPTTVFFSVDFNFYSVIHCLDLKEQKSSTGLVIKKSNLSCLQAPPPTWPPPKQWFFRNLRFLPGYIYNLVFSFACFAVITTPNSLPAVKISPYTLMHQVIYKRHLQRRLPRSNRQQPRGGVDCREEEDRPGQLELRRAPGQLLQKRRRALSEEQAHFAQFANTRCHTRGGPSPRANPRASAEA